MGIITSDICIYDSSNYDCSKNPVKLSLSSIKHINAGVYNSFAYKQNSEIYSWGKNNKGQLGNGTTENQSLPTIISLP